MTRDRKALLEIRALLASAGYAATFQTLASYRTSMLASVDTYLTLPTPHHEEHHSSAAPQRRQ